jgi:hypothetical protein
MCAFVPALFAGRRALARAFGIGAETTGMTPSPISFPDFAENSIDFRNLSKSGGVARIVMHGELDPSIAFVNFRNHQPRPFVGRENESSSRPSIFVFCSSTSAFDCASSSSRVRSVSGTERGDGLPHICIRRSSANFSYTPNSYTTPRRMHKISMTSARCIGSSRPDAPASSATSTTPHPPQPYTVPKLRSRVLRRLRVRRSVDENERDDR